MVDRRSATWAVVTLLLFGPRLPAAEPESTSSAETPAVRKNTGLGRALKSFGEAVEQVSQPADAP